MPQDSLGELFPNVEAREIAQKLLALADSYSLNSFSLTQPDLVNIGVAVSPTVALINHSCAPNVSVVFQHGPKKDMSVVAFKAIKAGEEILSTYIDLMQPVNKRQDELLTGYKFNCTCDSCLKESVDISPRQSLMCSTPNCAGLLAIPSTCNDISRISLTRTTAVSNGKSTEDLRCTICSATKTISLSQNGEDVGLRKTLALAEQLLPLAKADDLMLCE